VGGDHAGGGGALSNTDGNGAGGGPELKVSLLLEEWWLCVVMALCGRAVGEPVPSSRGGGSCGGAGSCLSSSLPRLALEIKLSSRLSADDRVFLVVHAARSCCMYFASSSEELHGLCAKSWEPAALKRCIGEATCESVPSDSGIANANSDDPDCRPSIAAGS